MPMDFENVTLDGHRDTGDLTSTISDQDLNKIIMLASEAIKDTGAPTAKRPNYGGQWSTRRTTWHSITRF